MIFSRAFLRFSRATFDFLDAEELTVFLARDGLLLLVLEARDLANSASSFHSYHGNSSHAVLGPVPTFNRSLDQPARTLVE